ncbi:arginyltransferase [Paraglaciecola sp. 2405UD69-4]|uniref:arginyltransferase n=1 Tax=Paraglaciecola sp. 2405UD69-4 TaxID=3391836 RepID=UPI0039C8CEE4
MKFGITQPNPCSYLPEEKEQILVLVSDTPATRHQYDYLISMGFRRSGEQVYRPHCQACKACVPIRLPVAQFSLSKSQKRILKRNQDLEVKVSTQDKPEYYTLFESYIKQRHSDGSMFPPSKAQYQGFVPSPWGETLFIEFYAKQDLIAVAITDNLFTSLSAMYTYFKPEEDKRSLGTFAILKQIELAQTMGKEFLYLGYQIDNCQKMRYKENFLPNERFFEDKWQLITKKSV